MLDVICITYFIDIHLLDLKTRHKLINADYRLHLLQSPIDIHWAKGYPPYDIGLYPIASKQVKLEDCVMEPGQNLRQTLDILAGKVPVSIPELPSRLDALMRPYQKEGFSFLYRITERGFLY